jgi:hypothetical protein
MRFRGLDQTIFFASSTSQDATIFSELFLKTTSLQALQDPFPSLGLMALAKSNQRQF